MDGTFLGLVPLRSLAFNGVTMATPAPFIPPHRETIFLRGARGCCPRCEHPELFASGFRLHTRCPRCALPLELEDGWSYGSVPLAYGLACFLWVLPVALLAVFGVVPVAVALVLGLVGVIILPIVTFRFTKQLWVGLYYALLPTELRPRPQGERGDDH